MAGFRTALPFAIAAFAIAGCDSVPRPVSEQTSAGFPLECTTCHGDSTRAAASALVKAAPATGAHLAHLQGKHFRDPLACENCHPIATSSRHSNGEVDLPFSGVPASGAATTWNPADGTCTTYCHGSATPAWTGVGLDCASCHGHPPASHDPNSTTCSACHPGTVLADGSINLAAKLHLNGAVDVNASHGEGWSAPDQHGRSANANLAACRACHGQDLEGGTTGVSCNSCHGGTAWQSTCTFCHGDATRTANPAAPPVGTQGETTTTSVAVGAHAKHLGGGAVGGAVACTECHAVPTGIAHVDGTATVTFGAAASRGSLQPVWDGSGCASTYCHGTTISGGTNKTPTWTAGEGEATCGTCHGVPPPAPHTTSTACGGCHGGYTVASVNATTHLNGSVDATGSGHPAGWSAPTQHGYAANAELASCRACHGHDSTGGTSTVSCNSCHGGTAWQSSCTFCHGDAARAANQAAPPVGTQGETATTSIAVGAHQRHLTGGFVGAPVACTECHAIPTEHRARERDRGRDVRRGRLARRAPAGVERHRAAPRPTATARPSRAERNKTPLWTGGRDAGRAAAPATARRRRRRTRRAPLRGLPQRVQRRRA